MLQCGLFSPGQIRYCQSQILWYMANREVIQDGKWPPEPTAQVIPILKSEARTKTASASCWTFGCRNWYQDEMLLLLCVICLKSQWSEKPVKFYRKKRGQRCIFCAFQRTIAFCPDCNAVYQCWTKTKEWTQNVKNAQDLGSLFISQWKKQRNFREKEEKCMFARNAAYPVENKSKRRIWVCRKWGTEITKQKWIPNGLTF